MNYGEDELGSFGDENEIKVTRWGFLFFKISLLSIRKISENFLEFFLANFAQIPTRQFYFSDIIDIM